MTLFRTAAAAALLAASFLAVPAYAHPKLLSSTPADKARVSAPAKIELRFSENLMTQFSSATLSKTGGGQATKIAAAVATGEDRKIMVVTPSQPLEPGQYRVEWRAVASDTHPVTGTISFAVQ